GGRDEFETEYLRALFRELDWIELFGINLSRFTKRYRLSSSYVRLNAISVRPTSTASDGLSLEIDDILSARDHHVILGQAGTGKTTLLQWLTVTAARKELPPKIGAWQSRIPFFIRLRQLHGHFPSPEDWLGLISTGLPSREPVGWVRE